MWHEVSELGATPSSPKPTQIVEEGSHFNERLLYCLVETGRTEALTHFRNGRDRVSPDLPMAAEGRALALVAGVVVVEAPASSGAESSTVCGSAGSSEATPWASGKFAAT
jgi:hypothetical protein